MRLRLDRRAGDRRRGRVRHAAARRRAAAAGATRCSTRSSSPRRGCRPCSSRRRCRARRPTACRSRPARATARRRRSASASTGPAPSRSCSGRRASSSPRCPGTRPTPQARVHVFCHAVPGAWHAMGVMLSAAGSLQWFRDALRAGRPVRELVAEAERWAPGAEGLLFLPYLPGERTPHADPDARGAFVGLAAAARPRRAGPRGARGRRVRAARLARPAAPGSASSRRSAASRAAARAARLWLRIVASVLGMPLEPTAADEGSAYGAALLGGVAGGVFADVARGGRGLRPRPRHDRARPRVGRALRRAARALPGALSGPPRRGVRRAPPRPPSGRRSAGARRSRRADDRVADLGGAVAVLEVAPCGRTSESSRIASSRWWSSWTNVCSQPIMWPGGHQCSQNGWSGSETLHGPEAARPVAVGAVDLELVQPLEVERERAPSSR